MTIPISFRVSSLSIFLMFSNFTIRNHDCRAVSQPSMKFQRPEYIVKLQMFEYCCKLLCIISRDKTHIISCLSLSLRQFEFEGMQPRMNQVRPCLQLLVLIPRLHSSLVTLSAGRIVGELLRHSAFNELNDRYSEKMTMSCCVNSPFFLATAKKHRRQGREGKKFRQTVGRLRFQWWRKLAR